MDITERLRSLNQLKELREKEVLLREVHLKEVHHRVKNNLAVVSSLLAMQARTQDSAQARASLEQSQRRVLSIALVHEHLYGSDVPGQINFAKYARQLVLQLQATLAVGPSPAIVHDR